MIIRKCKNCGSTAQMKMISKIETEDTLTQTYSCGCGYLETVFWKKSEEIGRTENGTKIYGKKS